MEKNIAKANYGKPGFASRIINDDKIMVAYRPELNKITGSVLSTIFLQQVMYWEGKMGNEFYKFSDACEKNPLYHEGDSWCEELGFTKNEFLAARKKIAYKLGKSKENNLMSKEDALIIYYTDNKRLTYYSVNWDRVNKLINEIYLVNSESGFTKENPESGNTKEMAESGFTKVTTESDITIITETTAETTTETTTDIYMDLTFIDDAVDKVKITKDQYEKLINKFTPELVDKNIISLDNYIVNGKGNKYKDHYRTLNTWCLNEHAKNGHTKKDTPDNGNYNKNVQAGLDLIKKYESEEGKEGGKSIWER